MKKMLILLTILSFQSGLVQARLGETPEQCGERYGKCRSERIAGVDDAKTDARVRQLIRREYEKNKILVVAFFLPDADGKPVVCEAMQYASSNDVLTEPMIRILLEVNSAGKQWTQSINPNSWRRSDGAYASFDPRAEGGKGLFWVSSLDSDPKFKAWREQRDHESTQSQEELRIRREQELKEAAEKALQGF